MRYILQIYSEGAPEQYEALPDEQKEAITAEYFAISNVPGVSGGAQLQPAATATTVRVEDGRTLTTDGPFAETKEALGGYYLLDADDLDAEFRKTSTRYQPDITRSDNCDAHTNRPLCEFDQNDAASRLFRKACAAASRRAQLMELLGKSRLPHRVVA